LIECLECKSLIGTLRIFHMMNFNLTPTYIFKKKTHIPRTEISYDFFFPNKMCYV
jgi:hypothetical protein